MEGSLSWEEKQLVLQPPWCWALGQACSASFSLEMSSQDFIQQTKGHPSHCWAPTLLPNPATTSRASQLGDWAA